MAVRRTATVELDELLRGLCCCELEEALALPSNDDVMAAAIFEEIFFWYLLNPNFLLDYSIFITFFFNF